MSILSLLSLSFFISSVYNIIGSHGCAELTGIGNGPNDLYTEAQLAGFPTSPNGVLFQLLFASFSNFPDLRTTQNVYFASEYTIVVYNALAAFEPDALDFWAREDETLERRRCGADNETIYDSDLYTLHYKLADVYAWYFSYQFSDIFTVAQEVLGNAMLGRGVDPFICDNPSVYDCNGDITTPWGLAYTIANETHAWWLRSGWNFDGSYNRDVNRVRFEDWRNENRYVPRNDPYVLEHLERWQGLRVDDGIGFIFNQEHIVPHIGYTGKSIFYTDDELCAREIYDPFYNYTLEIELLLNRLASLTDEIKMETELFDDKVSSLTQFTILYSVGTGSDFDLLEGFFPFVIESIVNYEATLAIWKAKVDYDRVRPTSIIRELLADEMITTYGGADLFGATRGTVSFYGRDFDPYLPTMAHSEYPSGSACICTAYANAKSFYYGSDNLIFPLFRNIDAFSSFYEPLTTPSKNFTLLYFTWSDIAKRCGETRVESGVHFTESVPAGEELCQDIGVEVTTQLINLRNGIVPDYIIDFEDRDISDRDCYPNENECRLPKQCENSPCMENEAGNCKTYDSNIGCKKCENGFYLFSYDYPCIDCSMSCGNCKKCKDFKGCTNCESSSQFKLETSSNTGLKYCEPK